MALNIVYAVSLVLHSRWSEAAQAPISMFMPEDDHMFFPYVRDAHQDSKSIARKSQVGLSTQAGLHEREAVSSTELQELASLREEVARLKEQHARLQEDIFDAVQLKDKYHQQAGGRISSSDGLAKKMYKLRRHVNQSRSHSNHAQKKLKVSSVKELLRASLNPSVEIGAGSAGVRYGIGLFAGCILLGAIVLFGLFSMDSPIPENDGHVLEATPDNFLHAVLWFLDSVDYYRGWSHVQDTVYARKACYIYMRITPLMCGCCLWLIVCTFLSRPHFCDNFAPGPDNPCFSPKYPSWPLVFASRPLILSVEAVCYSSFSLHIALARVAKGVEFYSALSNKVCIALVVCSWAVLGYRACTGSSILGRFLGNICRTAFLFYYARKGYDTLLVVCHCIPKILPLFGMAATLLAIFSWTAATCFHFVLEEEEDFKDWGTAAWSLFILATTANFPDVMMPLYSHHRFYFFFFSTWVVLACFILTPMCGAIVYSSYSKQTQEIEQWLAEKKINGRQKAFDVLNGPAHVSKPLMCGFVESAKAFYPIANFSAAELEAKIDDAFADGDLSKEEFDSLLDILEKAETEAPQPAIEAFFPSVQQINLWVKLRALYAGNWPWPGCNFPFLIMDVVVFSMNIRELLTTRMSGLIFDDKILLFLFVVDAILKCLIQGFSGYWRSYVNELDFYTTVICCCLLYLIMNPSFGDANLDKELSLAIETLTVLRACRYLRIFTVLSPTEKIMMGFETAIPKVRIIFLILLISMYFYSVVGLLLFGGLINVDRDSPYHEALVHSNFGDANYYANSFNDMPSSMVVLFELLLVNNWFVIVDGFTVTAGRWAYLYFISFWFMGVIVCLNIVVALFVDVVVQLAKAEEGNSWERMGENVVHEVWSLLDADGSGKLSVEEFRTGLAIMQRGPGRLDAVRKGVAQESTGGS